MYQYDDPTVSATLPTPAAPGTPGYFTDGNAGAGQQSTILRADFVNMLMMELLNVVEYADITPSKTTYNQVLEAIQTMIADGTSVNNYALDTGAANSYAAAYSPAVTSITDGLNLRFKVKTTNTGSSTFAPNGLTPALIVGGAHAALQGGELVAGGDAEVIWNSTLGAWVLATQTGGGLQVAPATKGAHAITLSQFNTGVALLAALSGASFTGQLNANNGLAVVDDITTFTNHTVSTTTSLSIINTTASTGRTFNITSATNGSFNINDATASATRLSISASGAVTMGGTLGVSGTTSLAAMSATTGAFTGAVGTGALTVSGTITSTGTASFNTSDRRLKKNIKRFIARPVHRMIKGAGALCSYDRTDIDASGIGPMAQDVRAFDPMYANEDEKERKVRGKKRAAKYLLIDKLGLAYEQAIWAGQEIDRQAKIISTQGLLLEQMSRRLAKLEAKK